MERTHFFGLLLAMVCTIAPITFAEEIGWPEAVARLAGERTKAETCVGALKGYGDQQQIARGRVVYGTAKAEFDAVIAGLITALGEGNKPDSLTALNAKLEQGASGLK